MRQNGFLNIPARALAIGFICAFMLPCAVHAAGSGYFSAFPELPVPPQMQEDADNAVRFDQPEGRVITLQAFGTAEPQEIIDFYQKTMPALGWKRHVVAPREQSVEKAYYTRDKEVLFMEINNLPDGSARLNVLLRPR